MTASELAVAQTGDDRRQRNASRTVVVWDGTSHSQIAIRFALSREKARNGTVLIVRIVDDAALESMTRPEADRALAGARHAVRGEAHRVADGAPGIVVDGEALRGDPIEALSVMSTPETLLILGVTDHVSLFHDDPWKLGASLVRTAEGPLAILPVELPGDRRGVLVGVDGSEASVRAAAFAADEAARSGEPLDVIHAWMEPTVGTTIGTLDLPWLEDDHRQLLDSCLTEVVMAHPTLEIRRHLVRSTASKAIVDLAGHATLLVLGARGYGPVRRLLFGSVSTACMVTMPCPVIIIGPEVGSSIVAA